MGVEAHRARARGQPAHGEALSGDRRLAALQEAQAPEAPGGSGELATRALRQHRGNGDVVRQELLSEKGIVASRRTVQRALEPYRQELRAEALATVRFETPPGKQLQIDFGERLVEIGDRKVKVFLFVATLGYSRRTHVRAFRHERQEAWFNGLESTFLTLEGVPEEVLFDNARALVIEHDAQTRTVVFDANFSPSPDIGASGHVPVLPIVLAPRARRRTASPM